MDGNWLLVPTANVEPQREARLSVSIRQGLDEPPVLWATDHESGINKKLWNPNPQFDTTGMGQTSIYRWKDSSGYEWEAGLVKPYGYTPGRRYPLVVQTHGFSPHEFLVDGSYTTGFAAQPLAAAGIMVLQMEDRSDRHQKGIAQEASLFAQGCAAGIQQLEADGLIDPTRVGIIGFSRTSWYVETTLVNYPKLFKAATIIDGVDQGYMNYILFCAGMGSCKTEPELANGGAPFGRALNNWLVSSPSFRLDRVQVPVRIEAINWYSILEEWEIYSSLFQQGKPVDFVYTPDGQHILQQPKQRYESQEGNVDWFRFWLQGFQDASPLGREEYRRWTKLEKALHVSSRDSTGTMSENRRAR
jgi:dipeptidyl aminopeptidase/acylaminoacyl peptidase